MNAPQRSSRAIPSQRKADSSENRPAPLERDSGIAVLQGLAAACGAGVRELHLKAALCLLSALGPEERWLIVNAAAPLPTKRSRLGGSQRLSQVQASLAAKSRDALVEAGSAFSQAWATQTDREKVYEALSYLAACTKESEK